MVYRHLSMERGARAMHRKKLDDAISSIVVSMEFIHRLVGRTWIEWSKHMGFFFPSGCDSFHLRTEMLKIVGSIKVAFAKRLCSFRLDIVLLTWFAARNSQVSLMILLALCWFDLSEKNIRQRTLFLTLNFCNVINEHTAHSLFRRLFSF